MDATSSVCRPRFIHLSPTYRYRHTQDALIAMLPFWSCRWLREGWGEKGNSFQILCFPFAFFLLQYAYTLASKDSPLSKLFDSIPENFVCQAPFKFLVALVSKKESYFQTVCGHNQLSIFIYRHKNVLPNLKRWVQRVWKIGIASSFSLKCYCDQKITSVFFSGLQNYVN